MKKLILTILIVFPIIMSCERDANIDLPAAEPKLVITSFISPQDMLIRVKVNKTIPVFGTRSIWSSDSPYFVSDAEVFLEGDQKVVQLTYDDSLDVYIHNTTDFQIKAGVKYLLTVKSGDLIATASCTVPDEPAELSIEMDSSGNIDGVNIYNYSYSWADDSEGQNYYRIHAEMIEKGQNDIFHLPLFYDANEYLINDSDQALNTHFKTGRIDLYKSPDYQYEVAFYLLKVDQDYYKYHQSYAVYNNDNPFAEPSLLYSNIEGGLGIFSAYNQRVVHKMIE